MTAQLYVLGPAAGVPPGDEASPDAADLRLSALAQFVAARVNGAGRHDTANPAVKLTCQVSHCSQSYVREHCFYLVLQGRKEITYGGVPRSFGTGDFFVFSPDLPVAGRIVEASKETPFIGVLVELCPEELATLAMEVVDRLPHPSSGRSGPPSPGSVSPQMLDAIERLLRQLDTPDEIPVLAPAIRRELAFRLLQSDGAAQILEAIDPEGRRRKVAKAIDWIKQHYTEPYNAPALATLVNMSVSNLNCRFRETMNTTPLQYQKMLQLQEARKLLVGGRGNVTTVARTVGYESISQFCREYSRLFGIPPLRDVKRLRNENGTPHQGE